MAYSGSTYPKVAATSVVLHESLNHPEVQLDPTQKDVPYGYCWEECYWLSCPDEAPVAHYQPADKLGTVWCPLQSGGATANPSSDHTHIHGSSFLSYPEWSSYRLETSPLHLHGNLPMSPSLGAES